MIYIPINYHTHSFDLVLGRDMQVQDRRGVTQTSRRTKDRGSGEVVTKPRATNRGFTRSGSSFQLRAALKGANPNYLFSSFLVMFKKPLGDLKTSGNGNITHLRHKV
jgi:hypothetical protein